MKILELRAENFKRLKAITIRPDGCLVQVTGRNESGKSSTLDSLWALFKGRAVAGPEPIRRGAERAIIAGKLGDESVRWEVERTFRRDKTGDLTTDLKVIEVAVDGSRRQISKSPQAVLDGFLGALSFDPLAFARAKPMEQFELLKSFVPNFDFEANSTRRKAEYDARTDINREAGRARATAATLSAKLPPGPKPKRVDVSGKLDELVCATKKNTDIEAAKQGRLDRRRDIEAKFDAAEELRARAATLEWEAEQMGDELDKLPPLPELIDISALSTEVANAERANAAVAAHEAHDKSVAEAMLHEQHSQGRTRSIEKLDKQRAEAIAKAQMPVEGLTLGDGIVLYNGLPFEQASASARLKVSCAVAMASNPELRIIRTYDGSLLDQQSLGMLAEMADSKHWQVWCERVSEEAVGFHIVDGEVANG